VSITIDKDVAQFEITANQRCIQYVSYNHSFEYYTAALSVNVKTIHYVTTSFRAKNIYIYFDDYRHSPPYATIMFQKICFKSELTIHMAKYLCLHKSVPMKYLLNNTQ